MVYSFYMDFDISSTFDSSVLMLTIKDSHLLNILFIDHTGSNERIRTSLIILCLIKKVNRLMLLTILNFYFINDVL